MRRILLATVCAAALAVPLAQSLPAFAAEPQLQAEVADQLTQMGFEPVRLGMLSAEQIAEIELILNDDGTTEQEQKDQINLVLDRVAPDVAAVAFMHGRVKAELEALGVPAAEAATLTPAQAADIEVILAQGVRPGDDVAWLIGKREWTGPERAELRAHVTAELEKLGYTPEQIGELTWTQVRELDFAMRNGNADERARHVAQLVERGNLTAAERIELRQALYDLGFAEPHYGTLTKGQLAEVRSIMQGASDQAQKRERIGTMMHGRNGRTG